MLFTCLKLLQTNYSKYATSFNMITNYFLWLLCCTIWKIDISIEILFAVTEFKPAIFVQYTKYAVILSFSFRPEVFLLWVKANTGRHCHSNSAYRFYSNLQSNLQKIQYFITEAYGLFFRSNWIQSPLFLNVTDWGYSSFLTNDSHCMESWILSF